MKRVFVIFAVAAGLMLVSVPAFAGEHHHGKAHVSKVSHKRHAQKNNVHVQKHTPRKHHR